MIRALSICDFLKNIVYIFHIYIHIQSSLLKLHFFLPSHHHKFVKYLDVIPQLQAKLSKQTQLVSCLFTNFFKNVNTKNKHSSKKKNKKLEKISCLLSSVYKIDRSKLASGICRVWYLINQFDEKITEIAYNLIIFLRQINLSLYFNFF